jgi:hypothetical protein
MHAGNLVELAVSAALEIWLVILLLRRHVPRNFPIFFFYVVLAAVATVARLAVSRWYTQYFYLYWCSEAVLLPLSLAALHEVFYWMFEGFYRLWWFLVPYYGTIALAFIFALVNALITPPVQAHPLISMILNVGVAVNFLRAVIVTLFFVLGRLMVVAVHDYAYGIMVGFGVTSAGPLLGYLLRSEFGTKVEIFTAHSAAVAYILGAAIWVAAFIRPEPDEGGWEPPMSPERMLEEVHGYLKGAGIFKIKR